MEKINLTGLKTNKEVTEAISKHACTFDLQKMQSDLSKDFVYQEEAIRKLYTAICCGNNAILYGPAGFGKSVLAKAICEYMGLPIYYKVGYDGMTAEELLGVPNMNKLLNDSTYEVAFENSVFANPGILILEEFCDTGAGTAAALKDVLTAGGFREGDTMKHSLISTIIITGNKRPEDLAIDDTTKAFYKDRFPIRHNVIWKDIKEDNYLNFFNVYFKDNYRLNFSKFRLLAKLCVKTKELVSPRIAAEAGKVMLKMGVNFLDTVQDIDTEELEKWKIETEKESVLYTEKEILDNFENYLSKLSFNSNNHESLIEYYVTLDKLKNRITKNYKFSEENMTQYSKLLNSINLLININKENFESILKSTKIDEDLDKLFNYEP